MLKILQGDAIEQLRTLPDESVQCCVTSPPYWGLRDYGTAQWKGGDDGCDHVERSGRNDVTPEALKRRAELYGTGQQSGSKVSAIQFSNDCGKCGAKRIDSQLGLEKTPEEYVAKMVEVFREVRRVLRKDGTLWLNLGDSYSGSGEGGGGNRKGNENGQHDAMKGKRGESGLKPKDLCGIPWRVAFALQADGWWLRSDIIWAKPNPMPESVTDRPTKAHEYLFLLTKSANYFYDSEAIREPHAEPWRGTGEHESAKPHSGRLDDLTGKQQAAFTVAKREYNPAGRNKRSVWTVATAPYPEAHFATYPPDLIKPCILAGTSAKGCCAKCGSPWERIVERGGEFDHETYRDGKTIDGPYAKQAEIRNGILPKSKTIGWQPTCACDGERRDEADVIATPTNQGKITDPTLITGRKGLNRPRENDGKTRNITRHEQRQYANQMRNSAFRREMENAAGSPFAHYIRTDRSGARPVPPDLLQDWINRGWLIAVETPIFQSEPQQYAPQPIPCTVLDPFAGSGTTGAVALELGRKAILIELNPKYVELIKSRCNITPGLQLA